MFGDSQSEGHPVHCQGLFHLSTNGVTLIGAVDHAHSAGTSVEVYGCIWLYASQVSIDNKGDLPTLHSVCLG